MEQSRIKQLELIQGVIARLAGHSSPSKVLLSRTGVIGAAARLKRGDIVWPADPLADVLGLDAFYLRREKMFRALYDVERQNDGEADST
jgi:hypothetical protein